MVICLPIFIFFLNGNLAQRGICMQGKCPRVSGLAARVRIHSEEISNPRRRRPVSHNRGFKAFSLGLEPGHRPGKIPLIESTRSRTPDLPYKETAIICNLIFYLIYPSIVVDCKSRIQDDHLFWCMLSYCKRVGL